MPPSPNPVPRRLPKEQGRRIPITIRLTRARYIELVEAAEKSSRTVSNLAMLRYERGLAVENNQ
ncbi:MAG: hypothetical protein VXW65_03080 [Pseudomonadota bacterium]|nr:hypothetical protein [Pseudomonadota bacterium]